MLIDSLLWLVAGEEQVPGLQLYAWSRGDLRQVQMWMLLLAIGAHALDPVTDCRPKRAEIQARQDLARFCGWPPAA